MRMRLTTESLHRTGQEVTPSSVVLSLIALLFLASSAFADGVLYGKGGRLVQEEQQHAFIEWEDGQERLYVATHFTAKSEPTLWLLPVPSDPKKVIADPVDAIPRVMAEYPAVNKARKRLEDTIVATVMLDAAPLTLPILPLYLMQTLGTNASGDFKTAGRKSEVEVHRHVEKLGMVVEVLTAKSTGGLEEYLRSKEIDLRAVDLASLKPYLETECALVCGWSASTSEAPEARALRIDFPSTHVFYPLLPTSAYELPLESSVYVRGQFQLVAGSKVAARCEFVRAAVQDQGITKTKAVNYMIKKDNVNTLLTRVVLPRSPKEWNDDLRLEPADSAALKTADSIDRLGYAFTLLLQAGVGAALGLLVPFLVLRRSDRQATDFLWAFWIGAAICLSLVASAILYRGWRKARFHWQTSPIDWRNGIKQALLIGLILPLVFLAVGSVVALCSLLLFGRESFRASFAVAAIVTAVLTLGALSIRIAPPNGTASDRRSMWNGLALFAITHCAIVSGICLALDAWLARY